MLTAIHFVELWSVERSVVRRACDVSLSLRYTCRVVRCIDSRAFDSRLLEPIVEIIRRGRATARRNTPLLPPRYIASQPTISLQTFTCVHHLDVVLRDGHFDSDFLW